jgi:hypothetical protein
MSKPAEWSDIHWCEVSLHSASAEIALIIGGTPNEILVKVLLYESVPKKICYTFS